MRVSEVRAVGFVLAGFLAVSCSARAPQCPSLEQSQAIQLAERAAEQNGYELHDYPDPKASFDLEEERWIVFFEHRPPGFPGGHFAVFIDGKTGNATLMPGE